MTASGSAPLGLICAIPEEIAHFGAHFRPTGAVETGGFRFQEGAVDGTATVLVEAGLGKVSAAMVATLLVERFGCRALLFSGVAGGVDPTLGIGDVVVADRLVQHDYGALVDRVLKVYQPGVPPLPGFDTVHGFDADPALIARAREALDGFALPPLSARATGAEARSPQLLFGTVVTGDQFVNCEATRLRLHGEFGALAVEMEGAAVAQVAARYGRPCLVVRSLSDLAGAESHMDFNAFAEAAAAGAAALIRRLVPVI